MPDSVVFLISLLCCVMLVDQLMHVCFYIKEQREKENSSASGADEDKEKNKREV